MEKQNKRKYKISVICVMLIVISYCMICIGMVQAEEPEEGNSAETEEAEHGEVTVLPTTIASEEITTENMTQEAVTVGEDTATQPSVIEDTEESPVHAPKVLVSGCTTDAERLEPGMDVTFWVTLHNTSKDLELYNMKVTYESESQELLPLDITNSQYIAKLGAGGSVTQSVRMHIPKDIVSYGQKLLVNMEYEDENAVSYTSSEQVFLTIYRNLGFHADQPIVPTGVESGQVGTMTVDLFNTGKATIYNIRCKLECRGFLEGGSYYLGNMEGESGVTATLSPIAANRQYGALGDKQAEKYGSVQGKIIITYEDEEGNEYEEELTVRTEILMPADEIEEPEIETIAYSSQWWISAVVLLVVIDILVMIAAYYIRKHRV